MALESLDELLEEELKDLYSAENQLLKALPRMAKKASSSTLKQAFTTHLKETEGHVKRLQQIAEMLEIKPGGKKCKAMEGLLEEGKEMMQEEGEPSLIDAAMIGAAQKVEHYEISGYGTARAIAEKLGQDRIAQILQETLDEEGATDEKLTEIAQGEVLSMAMSAIGADEDEEE